LSTANTLSQSAKDSESNRLSGTRIAIVATGIVLAMRYLHSSSIVHCHLNPGNIVIDWDWIIRIGNFSHCRLTRASPEEIAILNSDLSLNARELIDFV
jgi:serine/threonine protein kinase